MRNWLYLLALILTLPTQVYAGLDKLRFITEEYPPYNYVENGRLQGLAVELLERAFALDGLQLDRGSDVSRDKHGDENRACLCGQSES